MNNDLKKNLEGYRKRREEKNKEEQEKMEKEIEKNILKEKLEFYKDKKIPIHISFLNGRFANGKVVKVGGEFFVLLDSRLNQETMIFFCETYLIEPQGKEFIFTREDKENEKGKS